MGRWPLLGLLLLLSAMVGGCLCTVLGTLALRRSSTTPLAASPMPQPLPLTVTARAPAAGSPGVVTNTPTLPKAGQLAVHFIDVGQGDSILLQAPDGTTALIDGGYDNGQALAYLQSLGIKRIDVLLASHPHADHIGGLAEVLHALPVGQVWTSGASHTTATFERFLDAIDAAQVPYREAVAGEHIRFGELAFAVLRSEPDAPELNDTSLVLRLAYGDVSFLFTGDAERPSEQELLRHMPQQLRATVLKVGHHGSYTSSSPAFLAAVAPAVAVYSAGRANSYGHPHRETITALEATGGALYGTAVDGTVTIVTDGHRYTVTTSPPKDGSAAAGSAMPLAETTTPFGSTAPDGRDRNCADFPRHAAAQQFFEAAGGPQHDPHHLDGDGDGKACEALP